MHMEPHMEPHRLQHTLFLLRTASLRRQKGLIHHIKERVGGMCGWGRGTLKMMLVRPGVRLSKATVLMRAPTCKCKGRSVGAKRSHLMLTLSCLGMVIMRLLLSFVVSTLAAWCHVRPRLLTL